MRYILILLLYAGLHAAANGTTRLYNPYAPAAKDIDAAVAKAAKEGRNVLLQVGGNWCVWCYRFNAFVQTDSTLKKALNDNYIIYHLNYSKENRNLQVLKKLGNPQQFGFPVLVVLDGKGARLHTQDTGLLEKGNGYDKAKVLAFFKAWSPAVLKEALYKK